MRPDSVRLTSPRATVCLTSALLILSSLVLPAAANAQHSHAGHARSVPSGASHSGHPVRGTPAESTATAEYHAAHAKMMRAMSQPFTGDPDVDFRIHMIPHHQGAIDMARVAMRHANDPWTRQLAESVIVEQQREIAEMQAWLAKRGAPVPEGGQPRHIMGATSYRVLPEEPGTREEVVGKSWAPGAGVPRQP
jgi:hypothetical protein